MARRRDSLATPVTPSPSLPPVTPGVSRLTPGVSRLTPNVSHLTPGVSRFTPYHSLPIFFTTLDHSFQHKSNGSKFFMHP